MANLKGYCYTMKLAYLIIKKGIIMKKILSIICIVLLGSYANANDEEIVESNISNVTVFSQGAQIYRKSSYSISKGVTEVIIEGISPSIDPNSLQVKATGNVIILDSKYTIYYPKPEEIKLEGLPLQVKMDILALEDSLKDVNYDLQGLQDEIDVLVATKNILKNNGAIRGQGKVNDSIALLKEAVEYYTQKMMEINKKLQVLNRDKNKQLDAKKGMDKRLAELRNWQNNADLNPKDKGPIHRVVVTLKASESVRGKIDVSYLVSNAGWTPMYDLRSDIATGKVNLNYKAQVFQNTGVDWDEIPLSISTNNPYHNKTKPTLHPWYIDYYQLYGYRGDNARNGKDDLKKKTEALSYGSGAPQAERSEEMDAYTADQFVEVIDHVISAEFKIDLPYSIKSDNQQHMVLVKNVDLDADYKYFTVPKYDPAAYLVAQITKLDELQLVPAKANIFFDGSYIGETYLDPTTMDDTLELSLGKDPNIIVKRTLLEKECKDRVVGTKKERSYMYAIEVKNLKSKSIELVIQDQIPVTQNADIEITATELSHGELNKRTGIIEWKFNIKANGSKEIQFGYEVKHDKDQNVAIL